MQYTLLLGAFLAFLVSAQDAFTMTGPSTIIAATPFNITWIPSTPGTVSLFLRQGDAKALTTVSTIASSITNSGSYVWTPSPSLPVGSNYAFEIVDDGDKSINNYSSQFSISSSNTASSASAFSSSSISGGSSASATTTSNSILTGVILSTSGTAMNSNMTSTTGISNSTMNFVISASSAAANSGGVGTTTATGKQTSNGAGTKTGEATETATSTATGTKSGNSSTATGNAAVGLNRVNAGGFLFGLVGGLMVAL